MADPIFQIFPNTVLLFELDVNILLYESFRIIVRRALQRAGRSQTKFFCFFFIFWRFLIEIPKKNWKNQFFQKFKFYQFFALRCETFDSNFDLDKIYRRIIPFAWDMFREKTFSEMHSNLNLNGWHLIYFSIQILRSIDMSQTRFFKFSPTPYYSSSWMWTFCSTSHFE